MLGEKDGNLKCPGWFVVCCSLTGQISSSLGYWHMSTKSLRPVALEIPAVAMKWLFRVCFILFFTVN